MGMGSSWSLSILKLLVLVLVQGLASGVMEQGTLSVNTQKEGGSPLGSLGHGVTLFFRKQW